MGKKAGDPLCLRPFSMSAPLKNYPVFWNVPLKAGEEAAQQHYKLTVTKVGLLVPQEIGPELYAKVFQNKEIKDEAEFREKVRAELTDEFDRITGERLQNEIYEMLVHNTPIHLPVSLPQALDARRWRKAKIGTGSRPGVWQL